MEKRNKKGSVAVESHEGMLRLRFRYQGKRKCFALGLPSNPVSLRFAQKVADRVACDIANECFDETLNRYRVNPSEPLTVGRLFERFIDHKAKSVIPKTLEKYQATLGYLSKHFDGCSAIGLKLRDAERFSDHLFQCSLSHDQVKRRLMELEACWDWAIEGELVQGENPWKVVRLRVKVPPRPLVKPLTREEIGAIITAFRTDKHRAHYGDFVEFLLAVGLRTGEAIGLKWEHVSDSFDQVWIGEIITRGKSRPVKCNKGRYITLNTRLTQMLRDRRELFPDSELVFESPRGTAISDNLFSQRHWRKVLKYLEIDHRRLYVTRATVASHLLDAGVAPLQVSQLLGHSPRTLLTHYSGYLKGQAQIPEGVL